MNKYLIIGVTAILVIAGGWWHFSQQNLSASEKTTAPLPMLTWKVGDKIGDFTLSSIDVTPNPPDVTYPYYTGTATFIGTTTIHGFYRNNLDYSQWEFKVVGNDVSKIPVFPSLDKSNAPAHAYLCLTKVEADPGTAFSGKAGEATIQISGYTIYVIPKGESRPDSTCSGLVKVLDDKVLDPNSYQVDLGF